MLSVPPGCLEIARSGMDHRLCRPFMASDITVKDVRACGCVLQTHLGFTLEHQRAASRSRASRSANADARSAAPGIWILAPA